MVVEPGPVASRWARQMVASVNPLTQPKRVSTKGKAASHPTMHPQPCKVTQIASPTLEVIEILGLTPPVAGPSQEGPPALFEGSVVSGEEGVGRDMAATSGEWRIDCQDGLWD